jgi:hypothetical protein
MATIETATRTAPAPGRTGPRRVRVTIRRVSPWSVLKFSLLFYFCIMLVVLLGLVILYSILSSMGFIDVLERLGPGVGFGDPGGNFEIDGRYLLRTAFVIGLISSVLWSAFTVFVVFLYNLISDLVGGIEVTLSERH